MKTLNYLSLFLLAFLLSYCTSQSPEENADGIIEDVHVKVNYHSPRVKGREGKVWGDMLPYGEVWRAGANEATLVIFDKPVIVEGKPLDKGTYSLFMIPEEDNWTVIFNSKADLWGTEYESVKDQNVLEVSVQPRKNNELREDLNYEVAENELRLNWEYLTIPIGISAAK